VTLLDEKLRDPKVSGTTFPNGIAAVTDERHLYVTFGGKIMRYDIKADDTLETPWSSPRPRGTTG
jgi:sugar lactone lactonase YvrE